MTKIITIHDQTFYLHPLGVLFWHETQMLLVADVHLGKVSHFRKHGSAVPQAAILTNFKKLDDAISLFEPKVICFLGDLFHSSINTEWNLFSDWVQSHEEKELILIAGNHDIISPLRYEEIGIHISNEWMIGTMLLTHHPDEREHCFNLCGHVHPGILLSGNARQRLRLPCFLKSQNQLILPAFGTFTGLHLVDPAEDDQIFVLTENEVLLLEN